MLNLGRVFCIHKVHRNAGLRIAPKLSAKEEAEIQHAPGFRKAGGKRWKIDRAAGQYIYSFPEISIGTGYAMSVKNKESGDIADMNSGAPFPKNDRHIRVFVSSTFKDMHKERELLVKQVFPGLRRICAERFVTFTEVDLRWGITEEQAAEGKVLPICLEEIHRTRPYFIGILGERYGWIPESVPQEVIKKEPWLVEHVGARTSVTEMEILHGVLKNPAMAEHSFFFFRDPAYIDTLPENERSDCTTENLEDAQKLKFLKERIRKSGFPVFENYPGPEALSQAVRERFTALIDKLYPKEAVPDPIDQEALRHEVYGRSKLLAYVERTEHSAVLDTFAAAPSTGKGLVLTGDSGCGKTALLASWVRQRQEAHPGEFLFVHYFGATPESASIPGFLHRVMDELKQRFKIVEEIPADPDKLREALPIWLAQTTGKHRIIIVLDALNQIDGDEPDRRLSWLPYHFPEHVQVIASASAGPALNVLKERKWTEHTLPLADIPERSQMIQAFFQHYRKELSAELGDRLAAAPGAANALFLRTVLEELRQFGSFEQLPDRMSHYLEARSPEELFRRVLRRWQGDFDGGKDLVRRTLSYLWAARQGLSESEWLELLGTEGQCLPRQEWSPLFLAMEPHLVQRGGLYAFGHAYLREAVQYVFLPDQAQRARAHDVLGCYFATQDCFFEEAQGNISANHWLLLPPSNLRKVMELPYQWLRAGPDNLAKAIATLLDIEFLEAAAGAKLLPDLASRVRELSDRLSPENGHRPTINALRRALTANAHILSAFPATLFQTLWNDCLGASEEDLLDQEFDYPLAGSLLHWRDQKSRIPRFRWLRSLRRLPTGKDELLEFTYLASGNRVTALAFRPDGKYLAGGSDNGDIGVWDLTTGEQIGRLRHGEPIPLVLGFSEDGRYLISVCQSGFVQQWNLDSGQVVRLTPPINGITAAAVSPSGRFAAVGHGSGIIVLISVPDGTTRELIGHLDSVSDLAFSSDDAALLSASSDGTVRIWDMSLGSQKCMLKPAEDDEAAPDSVRFVPPDTPDRPPWAGPRVFSGMLPYEPIGYRPADAVACSPSGGIIAASFADGTTRAWNTSSLVQIACLTGAGERTKVRFLSDNTAMVLRGGTLEVWDVTTGRMVYDFEAEDGGFCAVAASRDGRWIATSGDNAPCIRLWKAVPRAGYLRGIEPLRGYVNAVAVSEDGQIVCAGTVAGEVCLWDGLTGRFLRHLNAAESKKVMHVCFGSRGRYVAAAYEDGHIVGWDTDSGIEILHGGESQDAALCVVFSADGSLLCGGFRDGAIRLWDICRGSLLFATEPSIKTAGQANGVEAVCFNPAASLVAGGFRNGTIKLWDVRDGKLVRVLGGLSKGIDKLVFSRDGQVLLAFAYPHTVKAWRIDEEPNCLSVVEGLQSLAVLALHTKRAMVLTIPHYAILVLDPALGVKAAAAYPLAAAECSGDGNLVAGAVGRHIVILRLEGATEAVDSCGPSLMKYVGSPVPDNVRITRGIVKTARNFEEVIAENCRGGFDHTSAVPASLCHQAALRIERSDLQGALTLIDQADGFCRRWHSEDGRGLCLVQRARIRYVRDDLDGALSLLKEAEQLFVQRGNRNGLLLCLDHKVTIHRRLGNVDMEMDLHKQREAICRELGIKDRAP